MSTVSSHSVVLGGALATRQFGAYRRRFLTREIEFSGSDDILKETAFMAGLPVNPPL